MEKKYQIVPNDVEKLILDYYRFFPSLMGLPIITFEGFSTLNHLKKIWTIDFFDNKKISNLEGLLKYNDTNVFVYYQKIENEDYYKIIFLFEESSKDSVIFIINSLTKYNVKDYENFNN
jgi:hypothetical protein